MEIQAIFFDIDGTLVSFNTHTIPQSTIDTIKQLQAKGIKLIIATGRAFCDINNLGDLQFDGYIAANGAYCVDKNGDAIFKNLISKENLTSLVEYLEEKPFPCIFMTDKGNFINYIDQSVMALYDLVDIPVPEIKPIEEIIKDDVYQLDAFVTQEQEADLISKALTKCEGSRWHPTFADINVKNNSKATGINKFIEHYGINIKNTMAFGDGGNDIAMLKHVAVGIAMGNAGDNVKSISDHVTASVDDNGIARALKHFEVI